MILFVLYYLSGRVGIHIRVLSGVSSLIWFPSGIGLAALVLFGRGLWPWIFAAGFVMNVTGRPPETALLLGAGNALGCWLGARLMQRFVAPRPTLATVRQVLTFVVIVVGFVTFVGSTLEVTALRVTDALPADRYFPVWRSWWLAEAMGALFFGGAAVCWYNDAWQRLGSRVRFQWDMVFLTVALITLSIFAYTPLAVYNHSLLLRPYMLFALMIWSALRFDLVGATVASLIVGVIAVTGAALGYTATQGNVPAPEQAGLQQLFLLTWGSVGLILAAAFREREEAIDARNEFLSIASHELKTPITSISLQLQLFQRELRAQLSRSPIEERWLSSFQRANQQTARLAKIVEQLLDISRIDRRDLTLQYGTVDLSSLIRGSLERLSGDIARANCPVKLSLVDGVKGNWDPLRVEQVFENLVSNAVKYAPGAPILIATHLTEDGSAVEIEVVDEGPGIEKSRQDLVFERFVRGGESAKAVRGLGLGLFISREIVEAHRGSIWLDSKPGLGTRFHVRMPLAPTATARS